MRQRNVSERHSPLVRPAAAVLAVVAGLGCVLLGVTTVLTPGTPEAAADRPVTVGAGVRPETLAIPDLGLVANHLVELGHAAGRR